MKYRIIIYGFLFLVLSARDLWGNNPVGMNITYSYITGYGKISLYKVRVSVYRECNSSTISPSSIPLNIKSYSCNRSISRNINLIECKEINTGCPYEKTTCQGGVVYGVVACIYEDTVTLNYCTDWVMSAVECCRSNTLSTLVSPTNSPMYVESLMDNFTFGPIVNSPQITNPMFFMAFSGSTLQYNLGAYDPDGDAVIYDLVGPRTSINSFAIYNSGYGIQVPFGISAGNALNSSTGDFTATPAAPMNTAIAIQIKKIRNNKVIGYVNCDIQSNVITNNNNNPGQGGIDGTNNYFITAYLGSQICFNIPSNDPDGNKVTLSSNLSAAIPSATFTAPAVPTLNPDAKVCWTPAAKHAGIWCFSVTAVDDPCSPAVPSSFVAPGITIKTYCIEVKDKPCTDCPLSFAPIPGKPYVLSAWVKESNQTGALTYKGPEILIKFPVINQTFGPFTGKGNIIDGWQRIEEVFTIPKDAVRIEIELKNAGTNDVFFDDIRFFPFDATMKSFVYDPLTMRLMAELDENNYASFYEYDEEGALILVKKETERGVMTIQESRNAIQKKN